MQGKPQQGGVVLTSQGAEFTIWSKNADKIELCLFDENGDKETARLAMVRDGDIHRLTVDGVTDGARYGYRAHGTYAPEEGLWFDPSKLLADPYATSFDRPFGYDQRLGIVGEDSQDLMPKAIVTRKVAAMRQKPLFEPGGLVYEVAVKPFTILHPEIDESQRGTVAAMAHPAIIAHLKRIGVDAVELMPITAWIDERHLPPLGLTNGWGYNPVAFMALDPRLAPGGMTELRDTVAVLHDAGIAVILDLVFNHTGESDRFGPTLSLRGLDNLSLYRHVPDRPGELVNDTGTGNTVACDHPYIRELIIDSLRHFVLGAGIDGFRFDLAPIIGRTQAGFDPSGQTLRDMLADEVLADRIMIAEPWDIGPGGYQLGQFPAPFLEWNDRARDGLRRYWRGDDHMTGDLATILAGSQPIFGRDGFTKTRSVNFLAAHDGFTLMDLVSNAQKHNDANGEHNRDGHDENLSWNNGVEGATDDNAIVDRRRTDVKALLSSLFVSHGTIMITAGDEGGRSQRGNNNAYCQDNDITWLDWAGLDETLVGHTAFVSTLRKRFPIFAETTFLTDNDVEWLSPESTAMTIGEWESATNSALAMVLKTLDNSNGRPSRLAILVNRAQAARAFVLPAPETTRWQLLEADKTTDTSAKVSVPGRSVRFVLAG